jgi:hypothetical protein
MLPEEEELRELLEQSMDKAINKWLDKQFATFGKWTLHGLLAVFFAGLLYLYFHTQGFKL